MCDMRRVSAKIVCFRCPVLCVNPSAALPYKLLSYLTWYGHRKYWLSGGTESSPFEASKRFYHLASVENQTKVAKRAR